MPFMITPALFPVINRYSRLIIISFALGASALAFKPIGDVLGQDALLSQISACILLGIVTAVPWLAVSGAGRQRLITSIVACLIAILPPFGTIAAPNPYMAAGYLFPGTGILGLVLLASLIILPFQLKGVLRIIFWVTLVAISVMSNIIYDEPIPPAGWVGLKTTFEDQGINPINERNKRSRALIAQITTELDNGKKVIIAPESVLGLRTAGLKSQLKLIAARAKRNDAIILVGVIEEIDDHYENSLLIFGAKPDRYNARQPVPFVMWKPWLKTGFTSHWFDSGVYKIADKRTAILICWEEWVPWPMFLSSFYKPEVILSTSNHGWTSEGQYMWDKQTVSAKAISRLYGLPIVRAVNTIDRK